ncbi:alpha amylase C-terminal domain-containing protein [bacterium]|nr:alpha amylase C-terminal domain-containing protein [bacterium]
MSRNKSIHIYKNSGVLTNCNEYLGAYFTPENDIIFKFFTFSEVKQVFLEIKPHGKELLKFEMTPFCNGKWYLRLQNGVAKSGDRYRYVFEYKGETISVKDPCSMWQDTYYKWSKLYNHSLYKWQDYDWVCSDDSKKISRLSGINNRFMPVNALRIYELHIGTFTKEGTYNAAKEKLKHIANDLHFNAIEIMPLENTYSFNWGYDGVDKYAPNHTYGTPDELKSFIDYAHLLNLNVIMDIVPNHLGPDIAELQRTGPYIEGENCFGYKFNFERDENSVQVRYFIIGAALNWLINYHCDGLRVDMTKFMCSDFTMKQMVAEINFHSPNTFIIAEDGRDNDSRVTMPFPREEIEENEFFHKKFIQKISDNTISLSSLGFDSEWDFPFHKQIAASVLGVWDCRIKNIYDFDYSLRSAQTRVKYPMSHDEIGNMDGTRLITKILVNELNMNDKVCEFSHPLICKLIAHAAQTIANSLVSGKLDNMTEQELQSFCLRNALPKNTSVSTIYSAYKKAVSMHKLVIGKVFSIPGPKMIFQGDEYADLSYFKFFRKFSIGKELCLNDKGYEPGLAAFNDSKLGTVKVADKYIYINKGVEKFVSDLNILNEKNISLSSGNIEKTIVNEQSDVHCIYTRKIYNDIFSVSNFSSKPYESNYGILFPKGKWKEIINSDNTIYAGEGKYLNNDKIFEQFSHISLPAYGIIFFEKV